MGALVFFLEKEETLKRCQSCEDTGEPAVFPARRRERSWDFRSGTLYLGILIPEL